MTTSTHKQFDFAKYIQKNLEEYNRIVVYFNNILPWNRNFITLSETLINIILQVKTAFNITDTLDISTNICYINIYDDYVKKIQKSAYIKQNRVCALQMLGQAKSNLFGWSDQEDGDVLDKYMSQQNVDKYHHNIIDLCDIPWSHNFNYAVPHHSNIANVQLCKENIGVVTQCTNICKDTYIKETYVDYKLKLDAVTCFIIREYTSTTTTRVNIMLVVEFNEKTKILADKLEKIEKYINGIGHIIANV
jgi:hypothetical protein